MWISQWLVALLIFFDLMKRLDLVAIFKWFSIKPLMFYNTGGSEITERFIKSF